MKLIVGLGNPGPEYEGTRHNAGFMAVERLAPLLGLDERRVRFRRSLTAKGKFQGQSFILAWPQTYMNRSGDAVQELAAFHKIPSGDILILYDDMDLPVGRLKMDVGGGAAGHNGLASIMDALPDGFSRLRIGIGRPPREIFANGNIDYVLGRFVEPEWPEMDKALDEAAKAASLWLTLGFVKTQIRVNRRQKPEKPAPKEENAPESPEQA